MRRSFIQYDLFYFLLRATLLSMWTCLTEDSLRSFRR